MNYMNFKVALYCATFDLKLINSVKMLEKRMNSLERHMRIDKVYLEVYRGGYVVPKDKLSELKTFFLGKGIEVAAGITLNDKGKNRFSTICYSKPQNIAKIESIITIAAELFDEIILDDFFFDNCKCNKCIEAFDEFTMRTKQGWGRFRMKRLTDMSKRILELAKSVNQRAEITIKYPNWYESYQELGYNTETTSQIFDYTYVGTETRDPLITQQSLQAYGSYFLTRYIENIDPNYNKGGWFDSINCQGDLNRFLEQLYLTLLAGAKEVTLFSMSHFLLQESVFSPLAGYGFRRIDKLMNTLKKPRGIATYKPFHSNGEDYLHLMLGMIGIPLECYPDYPEENQVVLTESAANDRLLTKRIKKKLLKGGKVLITTGLLKRLNEEQAFSNIVRVDVLDQQVQVDTVACESDVAGYKYYERLSRKMNIPIVQHFTNDVWDEIVGFSGDVNYPILLKCNYGNGELVILTVPARHQDLKNLPMKALTVLRNQLRVINDVSIEAPSDVSVFYYDKDSLIIKSFIGHNDNIRVCSDRIECQLKDIENGTIYEGFIKDGKRWFDLTIEARALIGVRFEWI